MKTLGEVLLLIARGLVRLAWFLVRVLARLAVRPFRPLLAAAAYLTILPTGRWSGGRKALARGAVSFPVVGAILGVAAGVVAICVPHLWQDLPAAALVVTAMVVFSRGSGLRGLSATADALGKTGQEPSRSGPLGMAEYLDLDRAYNLSSSDGAKRFLTPFPRGEAITAAGATALACALLVKMSALVTMDSLLRWRGVMLIPLAGKCAMAVGLIWLRYDSDPDRPSKVWFRRRSGTSAVLCGVWAAAVLMTAGWWLTGWSPDWVEIGQWHSWASSQWYVSQGLAACAAGLLTAACAAWWLSRRPAGRRVEALHAVGELAEVVTALFLAAYELRGYFGGSSM